MRWLAMTSPSSRISGIRDEGNAMGKQTGATKTASGALLCVLMLTGCVQINNPAPPPQATTEPPADGAKYASVVELRDAMVKAGLDCPRWDEHNAMMNSASSADCSENIVLATYSSWEDREKQMEGYRIMGESMEVTVLVGTNWTINSPLAEKVKDKLGGYLFKSTGKG
jgi:hypothetical protein